MVGFRSIEDGGKRNLFSAALEVPVGPKPNDLRGFGVFDASGLPLTRSKLRAYHGLSR
jgi:hypothetical protein